MTVLYKIQNSFKNKDNISFCTCIICKISTRNIVAFCNKTYTGNYEIFVADIVAPWEHHKVCSTRRVINLLEWNFTGELLLVGYNDGNVEIWSTHQQTLNSWTLLYKSTFPNESIIGARFFHNGKNLYFNTQKKDVLSYAEKFDRLDYRPTILRFGNSPVEGYTVVTASGLLGVVVIPKILHYADGHPRELVPVTHIIGLTRNYITLCGISACPSGAINIAVNFGYREKVIHCFKVLLKVGPDDSVYINWEMRSNFFLTARNHRKVTHLRWLTVKNESVIFVVYESMDGNYLEQWNMIEKHQSVHKLLQKSKTDFIQSESWERVGCLHFPTVINDICFSKLPSDNFQVFVTLGDNMIQVLDLGLKKSRSIVLDRLSDDRQANCKFVCADVTFMNQILLVFDNSGQMYAMQVSNAFLEKNFKLNTISWQVSLLEYCILSGVDASDIFMLNLMNLELLTEKLTENFSRQPAITRQFYYSNFLSLKSNMCRIQSKQQDFDNLIILHSISITFKSLLRPAELNYQDKGPADNLSIILSEPLADVDKVLFNLDAKDFTVEPLTLQSLQGCMQWVADLALNILNKLPEEVMKTKLSKRQGYDINRDIVALSSIRELLVMIRIWGLLNSQCLPSYIKSVENIDVLAVLFRLLTRLAQNPNEPDDLLVDECSALSTQLLIPSRHVDIPLSLLNCHLSVYKSLPLIFTSANEPSYLQELKHQEVIFSNSTKDGVSNLQLGSKISPIRKCSRCGFVNNLNKVAKTSALKAWCNRWIYCHCGGFWITAAK